MKTVAPDLEPLLDQTVAELKTFEFDSHMFGIKQRNGKLIPFFSSNFVSLLPGLAKKISSFCVNNISLSIRNKFNSNPVGGYFMNVAVFPVGNNNVQLGIVYKLIERKVFPSIPVFTKTFFSILIDDLYNLSSDYNAIQHCLLKAARHYVFHLAMRVTDYEEDRSECGDVQWLFDYLNTLSCLAYEKNHLKSKLAIALANHCTTDIKFTRNISIREESLVRKLLEMCSNSYLLFDGYSVIGTGTYDKTRGIEISFTGPNSWTIKHRDKILLNIHRGIPMPYPFLSLKLAKFSKIFKISEDKIRIFRHILDISHGMLIVLHRNAKEEAKRLETYSIPITPTELNETILKQATSIDGAILVDTELKCHAIGVILDGGTSDCNGNMARGARYNSAIKYFSSHKNNCFIILKSEDGQINIFPDIK